MPKKALTPKNFDYSVVEKETKSRLIWLAGAIRKEGVSHAKAGLELGRLLMEARDLCGEPFKDWVEKECGCSIRSAYRYMEIHREFGDCATVAQLELGAMYELTKSDRAKKKALKLADKGVTVTQSVAKKLVAESKPDPPPPPREPASPKPKKGKKAKPEPDTPPEEFAEKPDRKKSNGKPPKQYDRSYWYKQWDQGIGPIVRLVDKIADGVSEKDGSHHEAIQDLLAQATDEMVEWMGVKPKG